VLDQRGVTLFDALWPFYKEHEYCGELDGGVEGDRVWMTCTCGTVPEPTSDARPRQPRPKAQLVDK
jgi:hypothetical protein